MATNPIAKLFAELGFRVNRTGLNQFQKDLKTTAKQINSTTGNSIGGATKKATKQQQDFFRKVTQGTAAIKPGLKETWKNLDRIKEGFRSGQLTQEQFNDARRRSLARISQLHRQQHTERMKQLRAQELAARRATRAAGDPRQVGNHRLISALHSDTGLGLMVGGFAAAQSSRSFQEFVGMEQGLTAATGSAERAGEEMEFLIDLSQRLGLFVGDLGQSFSSFAAAARGSTLSSQEVRDTFEGIASQARVLNLSAADTKGVMTSLTQMMNKGTIMAEELKNQMGERLPGSMQAAARAAHNLGLTQEDTTQALFKAMEQGKLMAETFLPELSKELMKSANSGGALEAAMKSTGAAIGRFSTNVFLANKTFNEAGFDKSVRDLMNTLSTAINKAEPLWIALGKISEFIFFPLRAGVELFGALASKVGLFGDAVEGDETKVKLLGLAVASLFKWSRKLLAVFLLIPAALSGVSKIIDGEQLTWQEWALTLAGIAASLTVVLRSVRGIKKLGGLGKASAGVGTAAAAASGGALASSGALKVIIAGLAPVAITAFAAMIHDVFFGEGPTARTGAQFEDKFGENLALPRGEGGEPLMDLPKMIRGFLQTPASEFDFLTKRANEFDLQAPSFLTGGVERFGGFLNREAPSQNNTITIEINGAEDPNKIAWTIDQHLSNIMRSSSINDPTTEK